LQERERAAAQKEVDGGNKPISTVENNSRNSAATMDHLMMARDLRKKLELTQSA
jgi:hypothetical protein